MKTFPRTPELDMLKNEGVTKLLFLDFDGVINPDSMNSLKKTFYNPDRDSRVPNPHYTPEITSHKTAYTGQTVYTREPKSFLIRWSTELVNQFNQLTAHTDTQVVWLTTWREHMGEAAEHMGFVTARPQYFLPWTDGGSSTLAWGVSGGGNSHDGKVPAFNNFINPAHHQGTKIVWVDDVVLTKMSMERNYIRKHDNLLTVVPESKSGLSRTQMNSIVSFLK